MKNYLFREHAVIKNGFMFVFLCGSAYRDNKKDKRNILMEHLKKMPINENEMIRPIILEKNFMFAKKGKYLRYDDINLGNLYQIESLVNYISDKTIIIHETISTGAEVGLFISNKCSWKKTCLIIPDEVAVEEDKQGTFLKLAFRNMNPPIKIYRFYPQIKKFYISNELSVFHTFFNNDKVGPILSNKIEDFLMEDVPQEAFRFTSDKKKADADGIIYYSRQEKDTVLIEIPPKTILTCVCSMFSIKEMRDKWINNSWYDIAPLISDIKSSLKMIMKNTIEEKTGFTYPKCIVTPRIPVKDINLHNVIGMCLYLLKAAGLIDITKNDTGVCLSRHLVSNKQGQYEYFYDRYEKGIKERIENRIS